MIIFLACWHRFIFLTLALILPFLFFGKDNVSFLLIGIFFLVYAVYNVVGYRCRWKHIYCSIQNMNHKKMTPENIVWSSVSSSDVYPISAIIGILGAVSIFVYCLG